MSGWRGLGQPGRRFGPGTGRPRVDVWSRALLVPSRVFATRRRTGQPGLARPHARRRPRVSGSPRPVLGRRAMLGRSGLRPRTVVPWRGGRPARGRRLTGWPGTTGARTRRLLSSVRGLGDSAGLRPLKTRPACTVPVSLGASAPVRAARLKPVRRPVTVTNLVVRNPRFRLAPVWSGWQRYASVPAGRAAEALRPQAERVGARLGRPPPITSMARLMRARQPVRSPPAIPAVGLRVRPTPTRPCASITLRVGPWPRRPRRRLRGGVLGRTIPGVSRPSAPRRRATLARGLARTRRLCPAANLGGQPASGVPIGRGQRLRPDALTAELAQPAVSVVALVVWCLAIIPPPAHRYLQHPHPATPSTPRTGPVRARAQNPPLLNKVPMRAEAPQPACAMVKPRRCGPADGRGGQRPRSPGRRIPGTSRAFWPAELSANVTPVVIARSTGGINGSTD